MDSSCSIMAMILPLADHFLIMMDSHSKIELHIYMQVKFAAENVRVSIFSPDTWEVRKFYFYDFVALIVEPLKKNGQCMLYLHCYRCMPNLLIAFLKHEN